MNGYTRRGRNAREAMKRNAERLKQDKNIDVKVGHNEHGVFMLLGEMTLGLDPAQADAVAESIKAHAQAYREATALLKAQIEKLGGCLQCGAAAASQFPHFISPPSIRCEACDYIRPYPDTKAPEGTPAAEALADVAAELGPDERRPVEAAIKDAMSQGAADAVLEQLEHGTQTSAPEGPVDDADDVTRWKPTARELNETSRTF
jgi:hypothetical protein